MYLTIMIIQRPSVRRWRYFEFLSPHLGEFLVNIHLIKHRTQDLARGYYSLEIALSKAIDIRLPGLPGV